MRVNKLHLQDYGQFHEKDITLAPGVNVLYGANEAGKSTTKDFIVDMMYGIDDLDVQGNPNDHYEKKKPIGKTSYKGAMEVCVEGTDYLIERNFDKNEKLTAVKNLDTGETVSLQNQDSLVGTLFQTDRSTFLNTLCMSHMGVATDDSIVNKLNDYIVNMASTKSGDLDAVNAILELKNKKSAFSNEELEKKELELSDKLCLGRDLDAEIAAVKEEYAAVEASLKEPAKLQFTPIHKKSDVTEDIGDVEEDETEEQLTKKEKKKKEKEKKKAAKNKAAEDSEAEYKTDLVTGENATEETDDEFAEKKKLTKQEKDMLMLTNMGEKSVLDNAFVILFIGLILIAAFIGIAYAVPVNVPEIKMAIIGGGVAWVLLSLIQIFVRRSKLHKMLEEIEIEQGFEEAKTGFVSGNKESVKDKLKELREKEEALVKERADQEEVLKELTLVKEQIQKNEIELAAIDLAMNTIQDLSEEIYGSFGSVLNQQVSDLIRKITAGKYSSVKIDDQLQIMVKKDNAYISMDYLSTGTIEQIYLALRLSIANLLIPEDMPIVMDDTFITYDYQRVNDTLRCLGEYGNRQIIIFTGNPGISDMFTNLGITSNYISI
ncbi:MAG: ATP-binding protein [Lachnospiraceae bacterium]